MAASEPPKSPRQIALIAAVAANGIIGRDNAMPWHIPGELKHFKAVTMGHPVVMGRRTYESIGRALPGRLNVVVSRDPNWRAPGCEQSGSLAAALELALAADPQVFVIGGAQMYAQALPQADALFLTEIHADFPGDTHFPAWSKNEWQETSRQPQQSPDGLRYDYVTYQRRR